MGWKAGTNLACRLRACWYACSSCCTYDESCFRTPPISSSSPASELSLPYPSSSSSALISHNKNNNNNNKKKAATGKYRNLATFSIAFPQTIPKRKALSSLRQAKKKRRKKGRKRKKDGERHTHTHRYAHTHTHTHTQTQIHTHTHTQTQIHIQAGTHTGRHTSR